MTTISREPPKCLKKKKTNSRCDTYEAVLVRDVVGQFQFMEGNDFLHPLLARCWTVGMDVHSLGHFGIGFAGHHPTTTTDKLIEVNFEINLSPRREKEQTCCGICIGSRLRPQCPATECTWISDRVQTRGISFAETFA